MVLDKSTWPGVYLCMKRISDNPMEFGVIYQEGLQPGRIVISAHPGENRTAIFFDGIDALVEAGWTPD
jgi:hypothetical protein